jgi:hypothetical protein
MRAAVQSTGETPTTQFQGALLDLKEVAATLFPLFCFAPVIRLRWALAAGSGTTINLKFVSRPHWAIAASISLESRSGAATTSTASFGAAATAEANQLAWLASGLDKMGTRDVRCEHAGAWSAYPPRLPRERTFRHELHAAIDFRGARSAQLGPRRIGVGRLSGSLPRVWSAACIATI